MAGVNMTVRKQPVRRCTGCGEHFPKKELVRVVRLPDGNIALDGVGKMSGRGVAEKQKIPPDFRPVADGHFESLI